MLDKKEMKDPCTICTTRMRQHDCPCTELKKWFTENIQKEEIIKKTEKKIDKVFDSFYDLGGYSFYASKPAYELAKWAASLKDLDKGIMLKKVADNIETRKRNKMSTYVKLRKGSLKSRFKKLQSKPTMPPVIIKSRTYIDFKHLERNNIHYRESDLIKNLSDWKPHVDWCPPGFDWKKEIKSI